MKSGLRRSSRYLILSGEAGGVITSHAHSPIRRERSGTDSPQRRSASPGGYDRENERVYTRKRTNTASSGSGDRRAANKICRVCGDKAFSYNFNVITCESCKAFFRRNANKEKDIRCPFSEQCEINVVSRRFCQRCRLAKCFEVGMKKEWIMSEEARLEKKQRVEENRERRMLDALRVEGLETSPRRERYKSMCEDEASPSDDYQMQLEEMMPPFSVDPGIPPVAAPPTNMMAAMNGHQIVDPIPTTAANSLADVSSTTTAVQSMDIDPSSTMSGMGFIPPTIENSVPSTVSLLPVVSVTNAVENAVIAAQAQFAVQQQVQAAINQQQVQQQIVAAVVANQVAAQIAAGPAAPPMPAPMSQPMTAPIPSAIPSALPSSIQPPLQATLPAPSLQPSILAPSLAPPPAPLLLNNPMHHDMVTIPREVLLHLIENNTKRATSCSCKCVCGRYPPGANIVDEVTKDLLAAGQNASNCNSCDTKEEARLETAEDFQRNGLLPSEDSCVNWLNTQPNVVDPTAFSENSSLPPVEPYQPQSTADGIQMVQMSDTDPEIHSLTNLDRDVLMEVETANREWGNNSFDNYSYQSWTDPMPQSRIENTVRELANAAHKVACFRVIPRHDMFVLIRERCLSYMIMRGCQLYEPRLNQWRGGDWPLAQDVQRECFLLYSHLPEDIRSNDSIVAVLALLCLFDVDIGIYSREDVAREHGKLVGLLKRLLYCHYGENESRVREECCQLLKLLPLVRDLAARCGQAFHYDPQRIEAILADA